MAFSKTIQEGPVSITASEGDGALVLSATASGQLGGGDAAGFLGYSSQNSITLSDKQVLGLFGGYLAGKFPSMAALINAAVAGISGLL